MLIQFFRVISFFIESDITLKVLIKILMNGCGEWPVTVISNECFYVILLYIILIHVFYEGFEVILLVVIKQT